MSAVHRLITAVQSLPLRDDTQEAEILAAKVRECLPDPADYGPDEEDYRIVVEAHGNLKALVALCDSHGAAYLHTYAAEAAAELRGGQGEGRTLGDLAALAALEAAATPGPWTCRISGDAFYIDAGRRGVTAGSYRIAGEDDANAQLMALAPALLRVVIAAAEMRAHPSVWPGPYRDALDAALAGLREARP